MIYNKIFSKNLIESKQQCRMKEYFDISIGKTPSRQNQENFSNNPKDNVWISISDMKSS